MSTKLKRLIVHIQSGARLIRLRVRLFLVKLELVEEKIIETGRFLGTYEDFLKNATCECPKADTGAEPIGIVEKWEGGVEGFCGCEGESILVDGVEGDSGDYKVETFYDESRSRCVGEEFSSK